MNRDYCDCIRFKEKDVEAQHLREKLRDTEKELYSLRQMVNSQMYFNAGFSGGRFAQTPDSAVVGGI